MINDPFFKSYTSRQTRSVPSHRNSSPKVVSVPVHFFSSSQPQMPLPAPKESAALKIQRVFKGLLVRKSLKKISSIRNEVCKVENRINDTDIAELIRRDEKERLRANETLMSLLFKLDSIRGVDFGVRDFRKAVIRKAIALQETVDSIVAAKIGFENRPQSSVFSDEVIDVPVESVAGTSSAMIVGGGINTAVEGVNEIDLNGNPVDDNKRNIEILEKLMNQNEMMMTLMKQMFERNELQTRMLNSLSERVEQLDKGFICEKSVKKRRYSM